MEEKADMFEDAVSVNSINSGCTLNKGTEPIGLSRYTIYHSAQDLDVEESDDEGNPMMATRHDTMGSCSDDHENQVGVGGFWKCAAVIEIVTSIARKSM
jgi:hypothetical protein